MVKSIQTWAIALLIVFVLVCCAKSSGEDVVKPTTTPFVSLTLVRDVTSDEAVAHSEVLSDGQLPLTARGFCWGEKSEPTLDDSKSTAGSEVGKFSYKITKLRPGRQYFVRAFATNSLGTTYGVQINFFTNTEMPAVSTSTTYALSPTTAVSGGIVKDAGVVITAKGVCWSTHLEPTTKDFKTVDGTGIAPYTSSITGLAPGTTYYVRAYIAPPAGPDFAFYGAQFSITTPLPIPGVP